jgi:CRISPR-associated protein Cas1
VERDYVHLAVTLDEEQLLRVPLKRISELVLVGRVTVTTPALQSLLRQGSSMILLERSVYLLGRLMPPTCGRREVRAAQYARAADPAFCLDLARSIAGGKLRNQRTLALRLIRLGSGSAEDLPSHHLAQLNAALEALPAAATLGAVRCIEGGGSRTWFQIVRSALQPGLSFGVRS